MIPTIFEPTLVTLGDDPHLEPLVVRAAREWSLLTGRPRHRGTHSADDAEWPHPTELTQPHVQHLVDGGQR